MDKLPRFGKRELICLLVFTCNYVVSVWRGFLFLWVFGMGYVILLWHSLSLHLIILKRLPCLIFKYTVFSSGSFCQIYRVTDEALIAETAVLPNFFLMYVFFALKGSKLFIIICCHCSWMLCLVAAVKSLPALIYSADYILLLVILDHGIYSENSEMIICLELFSKQI